MIRHQTTRRSVLAAAVVGALALSLSACSGSTSSPSPSGSSGGVYQDPDYGFEVTVAPGFAQGSQHNVEIGAAGNVSAVQVTPRSLERQMRRSPTIRRADPNPALAGARPSPGGELLRSSTGKIPDCDQPSLKR